MLDRHLDDGRELAVLLVLEADIAGIDAVLVERLGAGRVIGQQLVADVMEIADDRHGDAHLRQPLLDMRHGGGGLVAVDGDAHQLGAGAGERGHLAGGPLHIGGIGIGHRLHDDGRTAAHRDAGDVDRYRFVPFCADAHPMFQQPTCRAMVPVRGVPDKYDTVNAGAKAW